MKILLLEDDFLLNELISNFLNEFYEVETAYNSNDALNKIYDEKFDIFIFDINLPDISGLDLLKELRSYSNTTPTIFISAYKDIDTLQKAFENGASDYIKKPFECEELKLRIENISSKNFKDKDNIIHIDDEIKFNTSKLYIDVANDRFKLTKKENEILYFLISHKNNIVSFEDIYSSVWGFSSPKSDTTLRTYIKNIRKIIGKDKIKTIYKSGYMYE